MERSPIRRTIRIAAGTAGLAFAVGVVGVGYKMVENLFDGDAEGQDLGQQFNDAIDQTPVGDVGNIAESAGEQLDQIPVVGKTDDMLQTTFNRPANEADACVRVRHELQVETTFTPQYQTGQSVAAQIAIAHSQGEVLGLLDGFLDANGIDLHFNTTTRPANLRQFEWATTGIDTDDINNAPFDDTAPDALNTFKHYAAGTVLGLSHFSPHFNNTMLDYVIMAGDVRHDASATAHEGILSKGMVIEMDRDADIPVIEARVVHEDAHAFQYYLIAKLGLPNMRSVIQPYNTLVPPGFRYAESGGEPVDQILSTNPGYFTEGPQQAFARPYGTTNLYEHGATAVAAMLVSDGLIGTDSPSWRSLYQQTQAGWLACLEAAMPNFTNATIERQLTTGQIGDASTMEAYLDKGPNELASLIES